MPTRSSRGDAGAWYADSPRDGTAAGTPHRVTIIFPGGPELLPLVEPCDCPIGFDHLEVYPAWSELITTPVRRAVSRLRARLREGSHP